VLIFHIPVNVRAFQLTQESTIRLRDLPSSILSSANYSASTLLAAGDVRTSKTADIECGSTETTPNVARRQHSLCMDVFDRELVNSRCKSPMHVSDAVNDALLH
jgi:hypothetical protein